MSVLWSSRIPLLVLMLFCLLFYVTVSAGEFETAIEVIEMDADINVELKADAALLMEVSSGKIIWEMNSRERLYPASLTKIMSLLVVMERLEQDRVSLDDQVYISQRASSMGGSEIFLSEGDIVSLKNLLIAMAVGSANDGAVAVAEHVAGSVEAFVEMMNEKAALLGMDGTNFVNPHGLHDPNHYSTAYDVMLMSCALLEYPRIHQWATIWMDEHFLQGRIRSGEVYLSNTNRMVRYYQGCDGLKTGFTSEAGNGISATAKRGETRFLAVVLGSPTVDDRYEAARILLDYGFSRFKSVPVVSKNETVARLKAEKGSPGQFDAVAAKNLSLLLTKDEDETFQQEIRMIPWNLPLAKGDRVGELVVSYGEDRQETVALVAAASIEKASHGLIFMRLLDRWLRFGR